jgi:hypothetical protein
LPLDGLEPAHRFLLEESLRVRATKGTERITAPGYTVVR